MRHMTPRNPTRLLWRLGTKRHELEIRLAREQDENEETTPIELTRAEQEQRIMDGPWGDMIRKLRELTARVREMRRMKNR